jgi:hypothetical protein
MFAADWAELGLLDTVVRNAAAWVEAQKVEGLTLESCACPAARRCCSSRSPPPRPSPANGADVRPPGQATRVLRLAQATWAPGRPSTRTASSTAGAAPTTATRCTPALPPCRSCKRQNVPHPRIVGLIETCEESGSRDLLPYIDAAPPRLGDVGLVVCLDSGAGNYDQLWLTTSLRGMASGTLKVEILTEGIHSGDASGLVPSSFRIMRQVLDRLEDSATGRLLPASFHCEVPPSGWRRRGHGRHPGRRGVPALPLGALRLRRLHRRLPCPPPPTRCRRCSSAPGSPR